MTQQRQGGGDEASLVPRRPQCASYFCCFAANASVPTFFSPRRQYNKEEAIRRHDDDEDVRSSLSLPLFLPSSPAAAPDVTLTCVGSLAATSQTPLLTHIVFIDCAPPFLFYPGRHDGNEEATRRQGGGEVGYFGCIATDAAPDTRRIF